MPKETFSVEYDGAVLEENLTRANARQMALSYAKEHVGSWIVKNEKGKKVGVAKLEVKWYEEKV